MSDDPENMIDTLYNYRTQVLDEAIPIHLLTDEPALCYIPQTISAAWLYRFYREREGLLPVFAVVNVLMDIAEGSLTEREWVVCDCGATAPLEKLLEQHTCRER